MFKKKIIKPEIVEPDIFNLNPDEFASHRDDEVVDTVVPGVVDDLVESPIMDAEDHNWDEDSDEEEWSEEDETRYRSHINKKKNDKIFNNGYNTGDGISEETDSNKKPAITLWKGHRDSYMHDTEQYSNHLEFSIAQEDVFRFMDVDVQLQEILTTEPEKKKFQKSDLNTIFQILNVRFKTGPDKSLFVSAVHIIDAISSVTKMDYKKIFDALDYENKSITLVDLDSRMGGIFKKKGSTPF